MRTTDDFEGYVSSNKGLRKGAMVSGQEYRRDNRDRKVEFPNKKKNEEDRRPKRRVSQTNVDLPVEDDEQVEYVSTRHLLTEEEIERLEALDAAREAENAAEKIMRENEEKQDYPLVLDCELYFPEEDEQE